jgi:hypothetical protein
MITGPAGFPISPGMSASQKDQGIYCGIFEKERRNLRFVRRYLQLVCKTWVRWQIMYDRRNQYLSGLRILLYRDLVNQAHFP